MSRLSLFLLFLLLPVYLIRFSLGPLPTTLLEVGIWACVLLWIWEHWGNIRRIFRELWSNHRGFVVSASVFLLSATVSLFWAADMRTAAGEWKAFYIEPALIGFLIWYELKKNRSFLPQLSVALMLCGLATALLAIYQHFTGWLVPYAFWENRNTYRVTAWYGFPNGVGLFLAPLIPLAFYLTRHFWAQRAALLPRVALALALLFVPAALIAIWYAKSTGALVGVAAGIGVLLLMNQKTRWSAIAAAVIGLSVFALLPIQNPIKQELLLQDRSGQIRLSMWAETWDLLADRPITGTGLASYDERIGPYHRTVNGEGIEIFHHPHNLFLTMWVNTGLVGLIAFVGMVTFAFIAVSKHRPLGYRQQYFAITLVVMLVMGLVDSPYIKNDLSIFFWFVLAALLAEQHRIKTPKATP